MFECQHRYDIFGILLVSLVSSLSLSLSLSLSRVALAASSLLPTSRCLLVSPPNVRFVAYLSTTFLLSAVSVCWLVSPISPSIEHDLRDFRYLFYFPPRVQCLHLYFILRMPFQYFNKRKNKSTHTQQRDPRKRPQILMLRLYLVPKTCVVCMYVCMYVCIYVCMYVCMYIYICIYICIYIFLHIYYLSLLKKEKNAGSCMR
jgi:hypothetical protein